jgi:phage gp46-like protein
MADVLKTDLCLSRRRLGRRSFIRSAVDLKESRGDLRLVGGRSNLAQAILNRLFTRQGELADLGYPDYGSRLYQLTGEPHSTRTLARAELYIRESLAAERRIKAISEIYFAPPSIQPDKRGVLEIRITVVPVDEEDPLTLSAALPLEG